MTDPDYLAFADRMQDRMESDWSRRSGLYRSGDGSEPIVNANMLLSHSVAALEGHSGSSRNDERARELALRLVSSPPFVEAPSHGQPGSGSQAHAPGWVNSTRDAQSSQHLVFDADVVDGLLQAWRARYALELPQETVDLIVDRIDRTARGAFWRYPALRLNQINWYALMYAAAAEVTGNPELLQHDLPQQLHRFTTATATPTRAGNLGSGLRFHYLPRRPADSRLNVDSAEYANIVYSFARFYEPALAAGMPAPDRAEHRLLREWGTRVLGGYWTHGGYLNWDTGLGYNRWHQTKKLALAQQALIGLASTEALQTPRSQGAWAKWIFDRGLMRFDAWTAGAESFAPAVSFDIARNHLGPSSARLGTARMQANAGRAIAAGLGAQAATQPPPLYAYDPDIGRLAVSTPSYNTAIIADNQGAFPYGGIELARLYDSDQDVASNAGGRPPAAFGLILRAADGSETRTTQASRSSVDPAQPLLKLTRAPRGVGATALSRRGIAYAGPFAQLRAEGSVTTRHHVMTTRHAFRPFYVETTWTANLKPVDDPIALSPPVDLGGGLGRTPAAPDTPAAAQSGKAPDDDDDDDARPRRRVRPPMLKPPRYTASAQFPSTGPDARVWAVQSGGARIEVGSTPLDLSAVSWFLVQSHASAYVVVPGLRPAAATAFTTPTPAQPSAPNAGPTLSIELARRSRWESLALSARIVPVPDPARADDYARVLGAR